MGGTKQSEHLWQLHFHAELTVKSHQIRPCQPQNVLHFWVWIYLQKFMSRISVVCWFIKCSKKLSLYCLSFIFVPRIEDWMSGATQQEQRTLPWCLQSPWCHARVACHEDVTEVTQGHVTISSQLSNTENQMSRLNSMTASLSASHTSLSGPLIGHHSPVLASHWLMRSDSSPILTGGRLLVVSFSVIWNANSLSYLHLC